MRFIVTGTPRSATTYSARLLAALDVPCTHECVLRPLAAVVDVVRWWSDDKQGESSWMAWTVLPLMPSPVPVIHVVRDPWLVIDSLANRNAILNDSKQPADSLRAIRNMIKAWLPDVFAWDSQVDRAAAFVVGWNRLIAERVPEQLTFRPAGGVAAVSVVLRYLGIERSTTQIIQALDTVAENINAGFNLEITDGISDPDVGNWIMQYAREQNCCRLATRKFKDVPDRQSPIELAAAMSPELLTEVNTHALAYGYQPVAAPEAVAA